MHRIDHRGLETAETEIKAVFIQPGPGKCKGCSVTLFSACADCRAAGIPKFKKFCNLVKGLAGGIIPGSPHKGIIGMAFDIKQARVSSGNDQGRVGEIGRIITKKRGEHMTGHVINADTGNIFHQRQGLGKGKADQERSHKSRALGGGNKVDIVQADLCLLERLLNQGPDCLNVGT